MFVSQFRARPQAFRCLILGLGLLFSTATRARGPRTAEVVGGDAELLFDHLAPSVHPIRVLSKDGKLLATGSCVAVGIDLVVTNRHVILGGDSAEVFVKGKWLNAVPGLADVENDLVLLRVRVKDLVPVKIGNPDALHVGQRVYAMGSPLGLTNTFSDGMVSGLRKIGNKTVIQHTAPISPGSSGGGLFNIFGRLIGVTNATLVDGQNINFAIPANAVATLLSAAGRAASSRDARSDRGSRFRDDFSAACARYNVPIALALAIADVESGFNAAASLPDGRVGLMPLASDVARKMYVKDRLDPKQSVDGGVRYLRALANIYHGDMVLIVAAYRFSTSRIDENRPVPTEAEAYLRKVVSAYFDYKDLLQRDPPRSATTHVAKGHRARVCARVRPDGIVVYEMCGDSR